MNRVLIPLNLSTLPAIDTSQQRRHSMQIHGLQGDTMGTTWSVKLVGDPQCDLVSLRIAIQQELDLVVSQMSTWIAESNISRFNAARDDTWHDLPEEFFAVLTCAQSVARASGGAYDPTVGPLVNLWGFGPYSSDNVSGCASRSVRDRMIPAADAVLTARARCGWTRLDLDTLHHRARQPGDLYVDLSSIAKGYAVDRVANRLRREGVSSYLVEVGGELRGFGVKPDAEPWWVSLELTEDLIVALHGLSIATSGDYRRYFEADGTRYSHTIDPRTGAPVTHRLASVSVLHPQCMIADAQSTALTVLGPDEGFDYACHQRLAALFIVRTDTGFEERMTPAFEAMLD